MSEVWDGVADAWEREADLVDDHARSITDAMLDAAGIGAGDAVLDLACGPGGAGLAAAQRVGDSGRVVLADVAPHMVEAAKRRAEGRPNVETATFDESAIDAPDGTFDAAICRFGLMFAPDPVAAIREAVRVLKPGGRYAAGTWGPRDDNPWMAIVFDAASDQLGMPIPPPGVAGPFALDNPERLAGMLRDGGLQDVTVITVAAPYRAPSLETWWEQSTPLAGPLAAVLAGLEPDARAAIRERAIAAATKVAEPIDGEVSLAGSALVASGRRPAAS